MSENERKNEKAPFFWISDEVNLCERNTVEEGSETLKQTKTHFPIGKISLLPFDGF